METKTFSHGHCPNFSFSQNGACGTLPSLQMLKKRNSACNNNNKKRNEASIWLLMQGFEPRHSRPNGKSSRPPFKAAFYMLLLNLFVCQSLCLPLINGLPVLLSVLIDSKFEEICKFMGGGESYKNKEKPHSLPFRSGRPLSGQKPSLHRSF